MSTGKSTAQTEETVTETAMLEIGAEATLGEPETSLQGRGSIAVPPRAREELKSLLRLQTETQERVRLVLATLEEALCVPPGWVIRDVDEGFVEVYAV